MSRVECVAVREQAPELALGVLYGAERAEALLHIGSCTRCQALVTELTEVADALPLAVPEVEPSPGFGRRVLVAKRSGRRRAIRRVVALLAATAAAATIVSVTLVRVIDHERETSVAALSALRLTTMTNEAGLPVGRVVASGSRPTALLVEADYAVRDGRYRLQVQAPDAPSPTTIGMMTVTGGRGTWQGTASLPRGSSTLTMLDGTGHQVCSAQLSSIA